MLRRLLFTVFSLTACSLAVANVPFQVKAFLKSNCADCHEGNSAEGGLDISKLGDDLSADNVSAWIRIHDRVEAGEMPPKEAGTIPRENIKTFTTATARWIGRFEADEANRSGRVQGRRLTNIQLERTLQDLLGIDIPLATLMPEEPRRETFSRVASGQTISHFQLATHLTVVDAALEEAFRRATSSSDEWSRRFSASQIVRRNAGRRCREPEMLKDNAVVWSGGPIFYGRLPVTTAKEDGWYRIRINVSSLKPPQDRGVWCTVRTGLCVSSAPSLSWCGAFEASEKPRELTFEGWLPRGHMFEVRPGDITLRRGKFAGGQVGAGEGGPQNIPGLATHSLTLQRFHRGPGNEAVRKYLFGDLEVKRGKNGNSYVKTDNPTQDAEQLMQRFAERAFRRPVNQETLQPYTELVRKLIKEKKGFVPALRAGYRALLCSPRFLHFHENTGPLDDFALASRISYMLWNSMPDEQLFKLASEGKLADRKLVRSQVGRMLKHPRGKRFVKDLAHEWLDLSEIEFTEPDRRLYPGFDVIVQESMLTETHMFLQTLLDQNLSAANLIESDFTYLNSRLGRYYGINRVAGDGFKKVALRPDDNRGGLLTQGSIMKVTANGTNTSPVVRGVWVSDRLLGVEIPPPPDSVPAIEPDIRGAKTIRDMLEKHKSDSSCAACHRKIDPVGFALENFDPSGRWRDNYPVMIKRRRGKGPRVDTAATLPDGQKFSTLNEFKKLVLANDAMIAQNVARQLMTYGTGAKCGFADRDAIDRIVRQSKSTDYGMRTILQNVIASDTFRSK